MEIEKKIAVMCDGSQIYYEKSGIGHPLFLLHGNGGSGRYFSKQVPIFQEEHTVYLIDSRGHGKSTNTSQNLSFQLMAEDLYAIMEKESIDRADILGFSDGANLAMVFAYLYPQKVNRLILNAGNLYPTGVRTLPLIGSWIEYFLVAIGALFSHKLRRFLPIVHLLLHSIGLSQEALHTIKAPTLILVGKRDVIKLKHSLFLAKNLPNASFVLVNGQGHQFARKNPELFNQEVQNFLKEK